MFDLINHHIEPALYAGSYTKDYRVSYTYVLFIRSVGFWDDSLFYSTDCESLFPWEVLQTALGLLPVEDSGFLEDVAEVDVGVEEVGVQRHGLLEVVDGKPYFLAVGSTELES